MPNEITSFVSCRNFWVLLILVMILNAAKSLKRTPRHLKCEFSLFHDQAVISDYSYCKLMVIQTPFTLSTTSTILIKLLTTFRPMVSEPMNSSLFHQLAEQLQQQNLEQFQKQLLEHQQHQQKVVTISEHHSPCSLDDPTIPSLSHNQDNPQSLLREAS